MKFSWRLHLLIFWILVFSQTSFAQHFYHRKNRVEFFYTFYNLPSTVPGQNELLTFFEIPYATLLFEKQAHTFFASAVWTITVENQDEQTVFSQDIVDTARVDSFQMTLSQKKFFSHFEKILLKPGKYRLKIRLFDRISESPALRSEEFKSPDYIGKAPAFGDILFLKSATDTTLGTANLLPFFRPQDLDSVSFFTRIVCKRDRPHAILKIEIKSLNNQVVYSEKRPLSLVRGIHSVHQILPLKKLSAGHYFVKLSLVGTRANRTSRPIWIRRKISKLAKESTLIDIIDPMQYVMRTEEWHRLKKAPPAEQKQLFKQFWAKRNPLPNSDTNPLLKEFYRRVEYANEHFSNNLEQGWRTDLGRIYIIYGPPDDIYRNEGDMFSDQPPYIIWTYYNLRLRFVFVDENNTGDYHLISQESY